MSQPSRHAYWTPENQLPEAPALRPIGGSPGAARSVVDPGLKILDNNDESVAVATHIGKDYSLNTEAAYVMIKLPVNGESRVACIIAAREAEFARWRLRFLTVPMAIVAGLSLVNAAIGLLAHQTRYDPAMMAVAQPPPAAGPLGDPGGPEDGVAQ